MKSLSESECRRWCRAHGIDLNEWDRPAPFVAKKLENFSIPSDSGQRVAMVKQHLEHFRKRSSVLVWVTEWGVWPSSERMHIFERFLKFELQQWLYEACVSD